MAAEDERHAAYWAAGDAQKCQVVGCYKNAKPTFSWNQPGVAVCGAAHWEMITGQEWLPFNGTPCAAIGCSKMAQDKTWSPDYCS